MKTQEEQLAFAQELQALTDRHGELVNKLPTAEDKSSVMKELQKVITDMTALRESYYM